MTPARNKASHCSTIAAGSSGNWRARIASTWPASLYKVMVQQHPGRLIMLEKYALTMCRLLRRPLWP